MGITVISSHLTDGFLYINFMHFADSDIRKGRKGYKMNFNEIIESLKGFEGTEEYENYIAGLLTADRVNKYLSTDEGKAYVEPIASARFTKGLETWKKNNLQKLVDEKVKELYPEADPKDTELAAVKAELEKMKTESIRKDLTNKALTIANEKGLPVDIIDYFIGGDEEATNTNLGKLEKAFNSALETAVESKLKGNNYIPPDGDDTQPLDGVTAAFAKLNPGLKISE